MPAGCGSAESLAHYSHCEPSRLIAGMFDDTSTLHDRAAAFYGIGPAADCSDAEGLVRRNVIACVAYRSLRLRRLDERISSVFEADRFARVAVMHAHDAAHLLWPNPGRPHSMREADGCGHHCGRGYAIGEHGNKRQRNTNRTRKIKININI